MTRSLSAKTQGTEPLRPTEWQQFSGRSGECGAARRATRNAHVPAHARVCARLRGAIASLQAAHPARSSVLPGLGEVSGHDPVPALPDELQASRIDVTE